jgi:hypothetical protein
MSSRTGPCPHCGDWYDDLDQHINWMHVGEPEPKAPIKRKAKAKPAPEPQKPAVVPMWRRRTPTFSSGTLGVRYRRHGS